MTGPKLSVAIPYKRRLDNLRTVLEGLANQTMPSAEFEVVVGAMEYSEEYVATCVEFADRLDVVSVLSTREFSIPRARNLATVPASGEVIVHMDADTLLPPDGLATLYRHFESGDDVCVVGQVIGYDNNTGGDIDTVEVLPYERYLETLDEYGRTLDNPRDPRFQVEHVIPWAFAWTGLIALRADSVRRSELYFDERFHGWGIDDLEWGYRVAASGTRIVLERDVYAVHLPHPRMAGTNRDAEKANYRWFLTKWPCAAVELAHTFGDVAANALFRGFEEELRQACDHRSAGLGTLRGRVGGEEVLVVGAPLAEDGRPLDPELAAMFDEGSHVEVLPLVGLALPYDDAAVDRGFVLPAIDRLSDRYRDAVGAELARVGARIEPATEDALADRVARRGAAAR